MADKVTMAEFEKRLSDGRYDTLTGARRGIGKMAGWSDKERAAANEKADAHFAKAGGAKKSAAAPKKAKTAKVAKGPKAAPQRAARGNGRAKAVAQVSAPTQLELPLTNEISKARASLERSKALEGILQNAARTKDLGATESDLRKIAAAASKDLIDSIHALLGTTDSVRQVKEAGDNGSSRVDTSVADNALAAAAAVAKNAVTKGPPVIPPLMGRQG